MTNRTRMLCYLGLATLLAPVATASESASTPATAPALRFYVSDVEMPEGSPVDADTANSIIAARMGRLEKAFEFVTHTEVNAALEHEALKQLVGSGDDAESLIRLGESIDVDRLLFCRIGKAGETYVATLTLFNLRDGEVEKRIAGTFRGAEDLAIARLNEHADQMLAYLLKEYASELIDVDRTVKVRLGPKKRPAPSGPSWMDVAGAGALGLGLGLAAGGGVAHVLTADSGDLVTPLSLYGAGGVMLVAGTVLVLLPAGE